MMLYLVLLFLLITIGCSDSTPVEEQPRPPVELDSASSIHSTFPAPDHIQSRIQTVVIHHRSVPQQVIAPGEVSLDLARMAKVSSRIEGQVEEVFVGLGAKVQKDQPLLAIGGLQFDELIQEYLVSKVQADKEQANFDRTETLLKEQVVSQRRHQEDQARFLQAKAVYQHMTEKLQNMGLTETDFQELEEGSHIHGHRYIVKAPLQGTISSQTVVLGQGVLPGQELFHLVDTSQVWVFANLPIEEVGRFHIGDLGTIFPKGREPIQATLNFIAPIADKATLTVRLRFDVDNPQQVLKPNEYVDVRLEEGAVSILAIPTSAPTLVEGQRGAFIKQENEYTFVPMEFGRENDGWIEVIKGLSPGGEVVVEGVFDLKNTLLKDSIEGE